MSKKKTALYKAHLHLKAKMINFAGWELPVEYEGLRLEHQWVRKAVGIFDVSHMGEIRVTGDGALETLEWVSTNYVAAMESGQAQYSLITNEKGGIVDDLIVYCLKKPRDYLLCVNAANTQKDWNWVRKNNPGKAQVVDESLRWSQLAVQGPQSQAVIFQLYPEVDWVSLPPFYFAKVPREGGEHLVAKTGYTGEKGCEIFLPWDNVPRLWSTLLKKDGVKPIGLGARNSLRTEMKYCLYGHEIDEEINPYEAGLGWVVKPHKDFIGKASLLEARPVHKKLIGFKLTQRGIPRQGYKLFSLDNHKIGRVTSGTLSPILNEGIGIAYVDSSFSQVGTELTVEIHNKKIGAIVVKTPFVRP